MAFRGKKRALPSEGRTGISESSEVLGGKKVRFGAAGNAAQDSEEEEDVEPADDLEGPSSRRNAVIAPEDGGSSDEESDEPAEPANKALDEDDDMFNSAPSKDTPAPKGKRDETDKIKDPGLGVREGVETGDQAYLKLGDLEGQEFQMLDQSDSDDQEEFEEDDIKANNDDAPRSRRSKKGMGYMMSGFNMKEELSEGRMTSDGCECTPFFLPVSAFHSMLRTDLAYLAAYIANKGDPFSRHDAWLDDVSNRKAIKDARAAKEAKEAQAAQQDAEQAALSRAGCMKELVEAGLLTKHNNENVLGALQRLGTARKAAVKNQQKAAKKQQRAKASSSTQMDVDDQSPESQELDQLKSKIDRLTTLAGTLLDGYGETEVYDWTYDDVVKDLRLEGEVPRVSFLPLLVYHALFLTRD